MSFRFPLRNAFAFALACSGMFFVSAPVGAGPVVRIGAGDAGAPANQLEVELTDTTNAAWRLQSSTDLASWQDRATFQVKNSAHVFVVDLPAGEAGAGRRDFFRFVSADGVVLPNDVAAATTLPETPDDYHTVVLPAHLAQPTITAQDNTPPDNPVTDTGATLGRVLFYDKRLSANNTTACVSCHQPEHGYSDPLPLSIGFDGRRTERNSMGLTSAKYYSRKSYFWDERAATLEEQVLLPIQNEIEMGMTLPALVTKLEAEAYYAELFTDAFGDATITTERISKALAQFIRSIVSTKTKYDEGVATGFANFTPQEELGRQIFNNQVGTANCVACHGTDNFVSGRVTNNGIENPSVDRGIGAITGNSADDGKFKSPSLRNIELTAPYMHDGRFATLEDVVEFYNSGVQPHPNLSGLMKNPAGSPDAGQPKRLNLTSEQKAALVAFMKTLTDRTVTEDARLADPFRTVGTLTLP